MLGLFNCSYTSPHFLCSSCTEAHDNVSGHPGDKEAHQQMEKRPTDMNLSPILLLMGSDIQTNSSKPQSFLTQNESDRLWPVGLMYNNLNKIRHVKAPRVNAWTKMVTFFIGCKMTINTYAVEGVVCPMRMRCWPFEVLFMAVGLICCVCLWFI